MTYRTKIEREWMTLAQALNHIAAAEGISREDAWGELRRALADGQELMDYAEVTDENAGPILHVGGQAGVHDYPHWLWRQAMVDPDKDGGCVILDPIVIDDATNPATINGHTFKRSLGNDDWWPPLFRRNDVERHWPQPAQLQSLPPPPAPSAPPPAKRPNLPESKYGELLKFLTDFAKQQEASGGRQNQETALAAAEQHFGAKIDRKKFRAIRAETNTKGKAGRPRKNPANNPA